MLHMAEGHREGIGGVCRFRNHGHSKQRSHHRLNMLFIGVAITGHRGFYQARRITVYRYSVLRRSQQHYSAYLRQA